MVVWRNRPDRQSRGVRRFIGIDTPEVFDEVECGGPEASASMERMLKPGDRIKLVRDRSRGNKDGYDRLLRYVEFKGRDLGQKQLSKGWASVYVFDFDRPFDRLGSYVAAGNLATVPRIEPGNARFTWRLPFRSVLTIGLRTSKYGGSRPMADRIRRPLGYLSHQAGQIAH